MKTYNQPVLFRDRTDAGRQLAEALAGYRGEDTVVFGVPRGGVPVAREVAGKLGSALDIIIVRKIPVPQEPEAGYGAITEDGTLILNEALVKSLGLSQQEIEAHSNAVRSEMMRRSMLYRSKLPPSPVKGKTALVIDDGLASGYTMLAAVQSLRNRKASRVVVAVPVASLPAYNLVQPKADDLVCLTIARTKWFAVASFYRNWYDISDEEVLQYLEDWRAGGKEKGRGR